MDIRIGIIGPGYVGLPLALEFARLGQSCAVYTQNGIMLLLWIVRRPGRNHSIG